MLKKLPIGIQTFSEVIEGDYLYIDKTQMAFDLIESNKYVFLSRPRRFGKSLFLDTLKNIFEGKRELFKDLYICDKYDWSKKYPVIKISFGSGVLHTREALDRSILFIMRDNQERLEVACRETANSKECFKELIKRAYEKYNQKVVVLIDEYDKPILDNITDVTIAEEMRDGLRDLYSVIKDSDEYMHFAFLTGVSKFSKVSIFSGLNNIDDISVDARYGNICGYTHEDIKKSFREHLEGVDLEKLKVWYNGYNFLGDSVYNPFDILLFISKGHLYKNYWFETGTPTFLLDVIRANSYFIPQLADLKVGEEILNSFNIENIKVETLLFQAGYLTIENVEERARGGFVYKLKLPNNEVRLSLNNLFIDYLTDQNVQKITHQDNLYDYLIEADLESFKRAVIALFASIPYNNYVKNSIASFEGYYASVIYAYLASLGFELIAEDVTNTGRIDLTLFIKEYIYIVEFKVGEEDALTQIKERNYAQKYMAEGKEIFLVAINFDKELKNVSHFAWESVDRS